MNLKGKVFAMLVIVPLLGFSQPFDLTPIVYRDYLCFDPLQSRYIAKKLVIEPVKDSLIIELIASDKNKDSLLVVKDKTIKIQDQKLKNSETLNSAQQGIINSQKEIIGNKNKDIKWLKRLRKFQFIGTATIVVVTVLITKK